MTRLHGILVVIEMKESASILMYLHYISCQKWDRKERMNNRFWKLLAKLTGEELPMTIPQKKAFLLRNHIALWDVIESCSIRGSSDTSIKDVKVNDFSQILAESSITRIYANGGKAYELYAKYAEPNTGIKAVKLPSTSPANAAWSLEQLENEWRMMIRP